MDPSPSLLGGSGPCVIRPFNFCLKSKIENWCQFLIFLKFVIRKNTKVPNRKYLTFFPFGRILKHDAYFYFNPVTATRRKIKLSGKFASPTMLQSVAWLSFSVFGGSLKFENWKLRSIFNFCFLDKTFQIVDRTTQRPLPRDVRFLSCAGRIYLPLPLPLPRNTSLIKVLCEQTRELTHDFLDYVYCYLV